MKTKKESEHSNGHAASPEAVIAKAEAAKRIFKVARQHFKMLKSELKQARKALKQARKASRRARKEAKIAKKLLEAKNGSQKAQVQVKAAPRRRSIAGKATRPRSSAKTSPTAIPLLAEIATSA